MTSIISSSNIRREQMTVEIEFRRRNIAFSANSDIGDHKLFKCSVFQKSDAKIEITIPATNLIRIKYPLSKFNYHLSGANVASFNEIHCTVFEQQLFKQ